MTSTVDELIFLSIKVKKKEIPYDKYRNQFKLGNQLKLVWLCGSDHSGKQRDDSGKQQFMLNDVTGLDCRAILPRG